MEATDVLTRPAFEAWLQSKDPDAVVGIGGNSCHCPLATYLQDTTGKPSLVDQTYFLLDDDTKRPLPQWARLFIKAADWHAPGGVRVSALKALGLLAKVR